MDAQQALEEAKEVYEFYSLLSTAGLHPDHTLALTTAWLNTWNRGQPHITWSPVYTTPSNSAPQQGTDE